MPGTIEENREALGMAGFTADIGTRHVPMQVRSLAA